MEIAIFGAGVAGLTAAVALRAQGHHCRLYERNRQCLEAGIGFVVMQADFECLQNLGLHLSKDSNGIQLRNYYHRNTAGQIQYESVMPAGARGVRRRDLLGVLMKGLPDNLITFDSKLDHLAFNTAGEIETARLSSGECVKADLYVAADGIHSRAREALFPDWLSPQARVREVVGFAECGSTFDWVNHNFNKFHADDGGIAFGIVPIDDNCVAWYLQFDAERFPPPVESAEARYEFVHRLAGNWAYPIPHLLAITDFARVHVWHPVDADPAPQFHQGNLVMIGDAAHPFLTFSSQGVSSAIADAVMLSTTVSTQKSLAEALASYSIERRSQCLPYIVKGRELSRHFLSPPTVGNAMLPIAT